MPNAINVKMHFPFCYWGFSPFSFWLRQDYKVRLDSESKSARKLFEETRKLRLNNEQIRHLYDEAREKYRVLHALYEKKATECKEYLIKLSDYELTVARKMELYNQFNKAIEENDSLNSRIRKLERREAEDLAEARMMMRERERRVDELMRQLEEAQISQEALNSLNRETMTELAELRKIHSAQMGESERRIEQLKTENEKLRRREQSSAFFNLNEEKIKVIREPPRVEYIEREAKGERGSVKVEYVEREPEERIVYKNDPETEAKMRKMKREFEDLKEEIRKYKAICEEQEEEIERTRVNHQGVFLDKVFMEFRLG